MASGSAIMAHGDLVPASMVSESGGASTTATAITEARLQSRTRKGPHTDNSPMGLGARQMTGSTSNQSDETIYCKDGREINEVLRDIDGMVNDAMGYVREGDYEVAEALLEDDCMQLVDVLPLQERAARTAGLLRKLGVIFEYQDRVDESHGAWARANFLEKVRGFGSEPKLEWALKKQKNVGRTSVEDLDAALISRENINETVKEAEEKVEADKDLDKRRLAANDRFIASVLAMARDDADYALTRKIATAEKLRTLSRQSADGEGHNIKSTKSKWSTGKAKLKAAARLIKVKDAAEDKRDRLAGRVVGARRQKKRRKKKGGKKKATIDELKKLVRENPEEAGNSALLLAKRYTGMHQYRKALGSYRRAISKELENIQYVEEEQEALRKRMGRLRSLKDKRLAELDDARLKSEWARSENIIVDSYTGAIRLLLRYPEAGLNNELVIASMPSKVEEARGWYPIRSGQKPDIFKAVFCAAPLAAAYAGKLLARFPPTERPKKRRSALFRVIDLLEGCVDGPVGDVAVECLEELLETHEDGDDLRLLDIAGKLYGERRHFRRAQELRVRAVALRRGEKRERESARRSHGEPLLHRTLHIDASLGKYMENMSDLIKNANPASTAGVMEAMPATGRSTTTRYVKDTVESRGTFGMYGDPLDDTWRGNLIRDGGSIAVHGAVELSQKKDHLVIPTTTGKSRDEGAQSFLRSVGVQGEHVSATGGAQYLSRLHAEDLRRGGSRLQDMPGRLDDMKRDRRRLGQAKMWHNHLGPGPRDKPSKQARVHQKDGEQAPWQGLPTRHWMEPRRSEKRRQEVMLIAAGADSHGAPPASAKKLQQRQESSESRLASAKEMVRKFGSHRDDIDSLVSTSRGEIMKFPPPPRSPLSTAGTRPGSLPGSSRGGMAFWMDLHDMESLDLGRDIHTAARESMRSRPTTQGSFTLATSAEVAKTTTPAGSSNGRLVPTPNRGRFIDAENALDFLESDVGRGTSRGYTASARSSSLSRGRDAVDLLSRSGRPPPSRAKSVTDVWKRAPLLSAAAAATAADGNNTSTTRPMTTSNANLLASSTNGNGVRRHPRLRQEMTTLPRVSR